MGTDNKIYRPEALAMLRAAMKERGIDEYLMTSSDYHASEYVSDYFKATEFISGCTSDNVVLIVGKEDAHLWTDGRYFISAAAELAGTGITLMKMGEPEVPAVGEFLAKRLAAEKAAGRAVLAFDGRSVDAKSGAHYRRIAAEAGAELIGDARLVDGIWSGRPALPSHPVRVLPDELCGKRFPEKLAELREDLKKAGADHLVLSRLDDIMWLLNIRGGDVLHNPVALSYLFVTPKSCEFFVQESEIAPDAGGDAADRELAGAAPDLRAYAAECGIGIHPYEDVFEYLGAYEFPKGSAVLCDSSASSDAMAQLLRAKTRVIDRKNPTELRKACKNETETANIRKYYLLDSAALCKFIYEVKQYRKTGRFGAAETGAGETDTAAPADNKPLTEMAAARRLDRLRAEIPGFLDLSFSTIPAYGANAAMAHYAPQGEGDEVGESGFLLVDSGGQYLGATTDVTRTIALGGLTEQMKRDFTLVAAGHFRLMNAVFKKGTTGAQLDLIAREPLFKHGIDYNHGTGHGIGYILNVHEGPQRIGPARPGVESVPVEAGMVTSDEPGVYREGEYGIRTESILLAVPDKKTEFGEFLRFECLTWAPVDRGAIDPAYLSEEDRRALNEYHAKVYEKVAPLLDEDEREWLFEATREI